MSKDVKGQSTSKRGLTDKQKRFVDEYLIDLNATQAAIRSGYSKNRASEIAYQQLQKTTIQKEIAERQKRNAEKALITQEMVVKGLLLEAEREGEGASHAARVSAWEKLGKHLGMFTDKVDVTTQGQSINNVKVSLKDLFEDEVDTETETAD